MTSGPRTGWSHPRLRYLDCRLANRHRRVMSNTIACQMRSHLVPGSKHTFPEFKSYQIVFRALWLGRASLNKHDFHACPLLDVAGRLRRHTPRSSTPLGARCHLSSHGNLISRRVIVGQRACRQEFAAALPKVPRRIPYTYRDGYALHALIFPTIALSISHVHKRGGLDLVATIPPSWVAQASVR